VKTPTSASEKSEAYTFDDVYDLLTHVSAMVKAESQKKTLPPAQQLPLEEATQSDEEKEDDNTEEEEQESSILENVHKPLFTGVIDRKKNDEEIMERIQQIQSHGSEKHYHTGSLTKVLDYFIKTFLTTTELDSNDMTLFIEKQLLINYCYGLFVTFPERFIKNSQEFQDMKDYIDRVKDLFTPALHVLLERRKPLPNSEPGYRAAYVLADDSFLPLEAMVGDLMALVNQPTVFCQVRRILRLITLSVGLCTVQSKMATG
jgi:hypothetical protein